MQLMSYKEALKKGKEAIDSALVPVRANKAKQQAKLELCDLEEKIATKEVAIHEETTKKELNFKKIIELQNDLGLLQRTKSQYEDILKQMFPE